MLEAAEGQLEWRVREVVRVRWWQIVVPESAWLPEPWWRRLMRYLMWIGRPVEVIAAWVAADGSEPLFVRPRKRHERVEVDADEFPAAVDWLLRGDDEAAVVIEYEGEAHVVWIGPKSLTFPDGSAVLVR